MTTKVNAEPSLLKDLTIGLTIFLAPVASFIQPFNLRQLAVFDIYLILISLIVILLALLASSALLFFLFKKIFKIRLHSIFLFSCFGFYLLFLFAPIHVFVAKSIFFNYGGATFFTILILFIIWLIIFVAVFYFQKFSFFFRQCLLIVASINILFCLVSNAVNIIQNWNEELNTEIMDRKSIISKEEIDLLTIKNISNNQNIYYVILDGMMSLDLATELEIIDEVETKAALRQADLTYVDSTYASYNTTSFSLAAILNVDYHITDKSIKYTKHKDTIRYFPKMLYQDKIEILLPNLISNFKSQFVWVGNKSTSCLEWDDQPWTCITPKYVRNLKRLSNTLYKSTPLQIIIFHLLPEGGDRNLKYYMEYSQQNKMTKISKFVFIHQNSPHSPYEVNENCQSQPNDRNIYEGYKASYRCVLKEVLEFMTYVKLEDPKAIVVIQADHGWIIPEKIKKPKNQVLYRAKIFNAIKAPATCFEKFGKPRSNVNTIRFVLNCAYGMNLPYHRIIHYEAFHEKNDPRYGIITSHTF